MSFHDLNGLRYYSFEIFSTAIKQAVFTRHGGTSPAPWHSLNLGGAVGDDPERVVENRRRLYQTMGCSPESIQDVWLVHGTDIIYADNLRPQDAPSPKADIIFTNHPAVSLFMRFGDCVPILFHDPVKKVIGLAHAGWLGTLRGVVGSAVRGMQAHYDCQPQNIIAGIGPSIGVDHYEVGGDVISQFREKYPRDIEKIVHTKNESTYLDLWTANSLQLKNAGVDQVQVSGVCTACHVDDWFSHRAEKGKTGRFGALMSLGG
jgi:YfiH family protein